MCVLFLSLQQHGRTFLGVAIQYCPASQITNILIKVGVVSAGRILKQLDGERRKFDLDKVPASVLTAVI